MNEKVVLIGAGSAMFTRGLVADILRQGWEGEVALVDIDPEALAIADNLTRKMIEAKSAKLKHSATTERREALKGATAVICTIGVGGRRAWEQDVFVPRKFGIYQPVGDSVMPGGSSRALRMIPAMVDIAKDVLDVAPDALFFNYGNPMGPVCRGVRKATGANVTGLCHGVFQVAGFIADVLGVGLEQLEYTAIGMNHLTWFTEVRADGRDVLGRLGEIAREKLAGAMDESQPFTWRMVELFGAFPAVLDAHITEFFPRMFSGEGSYYGKTLGVDAINFEEIIANGDKIHDEMKELALSNEPLPEDYFERIGGEHEQVTEIIESIRCDSGRVFSANLPNDGQIPNLPDDIIVECPAVADASGLTAIKQKPMEPALAGTLATRFQWVETIVDAALEGSRRKFVQALLLDGAVQSIDIAYKLADALLNVQKDYLPQFNGA